MQVLEIVRLSLINFGIGLLPFTFVALLFVLASHLIVSFRRMLEPTLVVAANTFVWTGLMVMEIVKLVGLVYEQDKGIDRTGSKYPTNDQLTDVSVMAAVYLLLIVGEVGLAVWRAKDGSVGAAETELKRGDSGEATLATTDGRDF